MHCVAGYQCPSCDVVWAPNDVYCTEMQATNVLAVMFCGHSMTIIVLWYRLPMPWLWLKPA